MKAEGYSATVARKRPPRLIGTGSPTPWPPTTRGAGGWITRLKSLKMGTSGPEHLAREAGRWIGRDRSDRSAGLTRHGPSGRPALILHIQTQTFPPPSLSRPHKKNTKGGEVTASKDFEEGGSDHALWSGRAGYRNATPRGGRRGGGHCNRRESVGGVGGTTEVNADRKPYGPSENFLERESKPGKFRGQRCASWQRHAWRVTLDPSAMGMFLKPWCMRRKYHAQGIQKATVWPSPSSEWLQRNNKR